MDSGAHTHRNRHTRTRSSHRASCSEVVFYQDHVGHLEPINTAPKVQTLDQRSSPHTITFTMGGKTKSDQSPASCQHRSNLLDILCTSSRPCLIQMDLVKTEKPDLECVTFLQNHLYWYGCIKQRSLNHIQIAQIHSYSVINKHVCFLNNQLHLFLFLSFSLISVILILFLVVCMEFLNGCN